MPFILEDFSPDAVLKAMSSNLSQHYWPYAELPGGEIFFEPDCTWFVSGVQEKWFNGVVDTRFDEKTAASRVKAILKEFRQRNLPLFWSVGPGTQPENLKTVLLAQGLQLEAEEPGMALNLLELNEQVRAPGGLTFELVMNMKTLREWTAVWMADIPDPIADHCREVVYGLGVEAHRPYRYFLARMNGKPVAVLQLFYAAGVVSLQHVTTLEAVRNQGIASALAVYALKEAREAGYRIAVLTSTPDGLPVYERLGFQTQASFATYGWRP